MGDIADMAILMQDLREARGKKRRYLEREFRRRHRSGWVWSVYKQVLAREERNPTWPPADQRKENDDE